MSKFFKALEQAERDKARRQERDSAPSSEGAREDARSDAERPVRELHPSEEDGTAQPRNAESPSPSSASSGSLSSPRQTGRVKEPAWPEEEAEVLLDTEDGTDEPRPPEGTEPHLVSLLDPFSIEAEQYRSIRTVVEERKTDRSIVVGISSPAEGDGKTLTATNLAGALAQSADRRVLLVDADFRNPAANETLGLRRRHYPGIVDAVRDRNLTLDDVVHQTFWPTLWILPAGKELHAPYEVLQSARVAELVHEARERFDYIVVDTPPMVAVSDCRLIEKWVDGFFLVVAAHRTPRKIIEEALRAVDPNKVIGFVFNQADRSVGYGYGYYHYKYYGRSRNHPRPFLQRLRFWRREHPTTG